MNEKQVKQNINAYIKYNKIAKGKLSEDLGIDYRALFRMLNHKTKDQVSLSFNKYFAICKALDKPYTFFIYEPIEGGM